MAEERAQDGRRQLGRVLVTGAAGFLGSALAEQLIRDGEEVVISDLGRREATPADLRACDLAQQSQVDALLEDQGIGTIIHAGAVSGPMVMADRPLDIWRVNVMGTAHLLDAARRNRVGRFVLCSSIDVYGSGTTGMIDEDTPFAPESVYGASKVAAEAAMTGYIREHGIDALAVRFSWIYGPGRRTATTLERVIRSGLAGQAVTLGEDPQQRTHYLFIDDAIAGVLAAAKAPVGLPRHAYNITAGHGLTFAEVARILADLLPELRVTFGGNFTRAPGPDGFAAANALHDLGYAASVTMSAGLSRYMAALRGASAIP